MGMAMGQDCELLSEVSGWIAAAASKPVWAKMTPNVTDITLPARAALDAGLAGVAAINTIQVGLGVCVRVCAVCVCVCCVCVRLRVPRSTRSRRMWVCV